MVLKQLRYLLALSRLRHFGRAAQACNVSQPTLSAAIRNLEADLGVPIVERSHAFNGFTPEGKIVLDHASRIMAEAEAMRQSLDEMSQGLAGQLRLGVIPTALPMVTLLTAPYYARYPKVSVSLLSLTSAEILARIENFELDAGITYLDSEPLNEALSKPLYTEDYLFLTSLGGPHAGRDIITWSDAADSPLCLLTPDMQNRRIVDSVFRSVGKMPRPAMETNSIISLCSHAAGGQWSSIVPRPLLQFFGMPSGTCALRLVEPDVSRTIGLVIANRDPLSPLSRSLYNMAGPIDVGARLGPLGDH